MKGNLHTYTHKAAYSFLSLLFFFARGGEEEEGGERGEGGEIKVEERGKGEERGGVGEKL